MTTSPVVSITDELIAELEALAINATPGPWRYEAGEEDTDGPAAWPEVYAGDVAVIGDEGFYGDNEQDEADAEYIALANPSTILALLAERADLKLQLAAASVDAERVDWLAEQFKTCTVYMDGQHPYYPNSIKLRTLRGPTFRMAIDAARNIGSGD